MAAEGEQETVFYTSEQLAGEPLAPPAKTECIHPGKDPKCGNCPDREEEVKAESKTPAKKAKSNYPAKKAKSKSPAKKAESETPAKKAKTECIHPGKDPKCGDCPDKVVGDKTVDQTQEVPEVIKSIVEEEQEKEFTAPVDMWENPDPKLLKNLEAMRKFSIKYA